MPLHVESQGDGARLLCIHGLGGGAYFFTSLGEALKERVRTVSFDLPGHGFSPRDPLGFCFDRVAAKVVALAREQGPHRSVLLGHSLGVIVALKAYALAPELFGGLVCVGGLPEATEESRARLLERAAFIRSRGTLAGMGESILPYLVAPRFLQSMPGMLGPMRRLVEVNDAVAYAETCEALARASARNVVPTVRVPCRLIVGSEDRYATPAAVRSFAQELPGSSAVIELASCGHFPFFECPAEFYTAVAAFVAGL